MLVCTPVPCLPRHAYLRVDLPLQPKLPLLPVNLHLLGVETERVEPEGRRQERSRHEPNAPCHLPIPVVESCVSNYCTYPVQSTVQSTKVWIAPGLVNPRCGLVTPR